MSIPLSGQWVQIGLFILALIIVWIVIRSVLRITLRIFSMGCGAILLLGVVLLVLRWLSHP